MNKAILLNELLKEDEEAIVKLIALYKLRLKTHSFWRILYYKKHPDVPMLAHEYVLILRKPKLQFLA